VKNGGDAVEAIGPLRSSCSETAKAHAERPYPTIARLAQCGQPWLGRRLASPTPIGRPSAPVEAMADTILEFGPSARWGLTEAYAPLARAAVRTGQQKDIGTFYWSSRPIGNPTMIPLSNLSVAQLLAGYAAYMAELRDREIVRSANNPLADYAEHLFCRAFKWEPAKKVEAGYDATDMKTGKRYQIKARRITPKSTSRQLSFIRKLDAPARPFDALAGVLMDEQFRITRAALVPFDVVYASATRVESINGWRFVLRDDIWKLDGVEEVTKQLREAEAEIDAHRPFPPQGAI
jgi:hypothetical protein